MIKLFNLCLEHNCLREKSQQLIFPECPSSLIHLKYIQINQVTIPSVRKWEGPAPGENGLENIPAEGFVLDLSNNPVNIL